MQKAFVGSVVLTAAMGLGACSSTSNSSSSSSSPSGPKPVSSKIAADAKRVQAEVENVLTALGLAIKTPSHDNVTQLAQVAQEAHDKLNTYRYEIAIDSSGAAGTDLFQAANDLKNSMGALVAYTGKPNPATLGSFNTQYSKAVDEWNTAVGEVYDGKVGTPPTIPTGTGS